MQSAILVFQIILGVLLITSILLQAQGSGLGATWGGGGETYHTRRGLEKVLFYFTIIGIGLFVVSSIAYFLV
jgi:protein translocase SecG subunit